MTLAQISKNYETAAELLRLQLRQLRRDLKNAHDPEEIWHLQRLI